MTTPRSILKVSFIFLGPARRAIFGIKAQIAFSTFSPLGVHAEIALDFAQRRQGCSRWNADAIGAFAAAGWFSKGIIDGGSNLPTSPLP
jgi:hypothetical protein